jgi:hypothetical protein
MADTTKGLVMRTMTSISRLVALVALLALMLTALPSTAMAQNGNYGNQGGNSAFADACQNEGWRSLYDAGGNPFTNQGDCVSYGAQGGHIPIPTITVAWRWVGQPNGCGVTITANGFPNGSYTVYGIGGWAPVMEIENGTGSVVMTDDIYVVPMGRSGFITINGISQPTTISCAPPT